MGLFPIAMNIVQFWLIDTIVKGSSNYTPLALTSDSPRGSSDSDREPLFQASDDDDNEDAALHAITRS